MNDVLARIVAHKQTEIAAARLERPLARLQQRLATAPAPRDFVGALKSGPGVRVIAEVKRSSPSAGLIRDDFHPVTIAQTYERHGAACISVLTDQKFFGGSLADLEAVRAAVQVPVLRKDFILDEYQLVEARAAGADCVLLIAECLADAELTRLYKAARDLGLAVLVELYEPENLDRVLALDPPLLGVNNRNLRTMTTDLSHCIALRARVPDSKLLVGESGIHSRADVERLLAAGIRAVLVGETLMRSADIGKTLDDLRGFESG